MATAILVGAGVGDGVSKLSDAIIHVITQTWLFKRKLTLIQSTINRNKPNFVAIEKQAQKLSWGKDQLEMVGVQLKDGETLVLRCERIKFYNLWKKYTHSKDLDQFHESLLRLCQIDLQLLMARGFLDLEVLLEMRNKKGDPRQRSCGVPLLKGDVLGFDDQVRTLKTMVLGDSAGDECSVVVVSAARGCGKTTLVTKLCHDPEIKAKYGRNIYFVTISETPNLKLVIKNLLGRKRADFVNDDDAINQWGSFLCENGSQVLLVLDDVWSDSIIKKFKFQFHGYKILVTSRTTYQQFNAYRLQPLNIQDATHLFLLSAASEFGSKNHNIPNHLVEKVVKGCKNNPLVLGVVGDLLKGKTVMEWVAMVNNLFDGQNSVVFNEESPIKQIILDLGLRPDDQQVSARMIMDKWVHSSKDGEDRSATAIQFDHHLLFKKPSFLLRIRNLTFSGSSEGVLGVVGDGLCLRDASSRLSNAIVNINMKANHFRMQLNKIQEIITRNKPFFDEIDNLIEALDRPKQEKEMFVAQLQSAEALVLKCGDLKWNLFKRCTYALKLKRLDASMVKFCEIDAPSVMGRGILDLLEARGVQNQYAS